MSDLTRYAIGRPSEWVGRTIKAVHVDDDHIMFVFDGASIVFGATPAGRLSAVGVQKPTAEEAERALQALINRGLYDPTTGLFAWDEDAA